MVGNKQQSGRGLLADAALIVVAVVAFVTTAIGLGDANIELQAFDYRALFSYQLDFYRDALRDGRLPLWNPHTFGGWPFIANPQSRVFYLTSLLYVWLAQPLALVIELILHLVLAGVGTYALARGSLGTTRGAALFAAIVFALSGAVFSRVLFGHRLLILAIAYVPLLAFVIDRAVARAGPWPWIGAVLLGLQILSGGLPVVWLGMVFIGVWRLSAILVQGPIDHRLWFREGFVLAVVSVLAILLASIQLLPSWELSQLSNRPGHDLDYVSYGSYDPQFLATLFWRVDVARNPDWWWGHYSYLGILPVGLAVIGLLGGWRDHRVQALLIVGAFMSLYMLGKNSFLLPILFEYVPTFDLFRHPSRALFVVQLMITLLAAVGLDTVWQRFGGRFRQRTALLSVVVACICLLSWIDLVTAARWYRHTAFVPDRWDQDNAAQLQHARILADDRSWHRYWFNRGLFRQNHAFASDARSIDGYDVMMLDRYERFIHFMTDTPRDLRQLTYITPMIFATTPSPFPFKILGVKYVDLPGRILTRTDAKSLSRAWTVGRVKLVEDEDTALQHMRSDAFQPHAEVVIESTEARKFGISMAQNAEVANSLVTRVNVTELTPEELAIEIGPHPRGYLVMSEIYYPGWRAQIGQLETPIIRCNFMLRCLRLTGSDNPVQIKIEFRPATLRWGATISGLTLLFVVSGFWFSQRN